MTAMLDPSSYSSYVLPAKYTPNMTLPLTRKALSRLDRIFTKCHVDYPHASILTEEQVRSAWESTPITVREGFTLETWPSKSFGSYFKILVK